MVDRICPNGLQLNKAKSSNAEAPFWTVSTKIYDKWYDFDFDIVNFPYLDGDVPRHTSYMKYISQLIRIARASSNLSDFNCSNKALTAKLLRQGYHSYKLRNGSHGPNKYVLFTTMEAEGECWDSLKLA